MAPGGTNIVLFNPLLVKNGPSKLIEISDIRIDYSQTNPREEQWLY
jgi:hypothetical protein